MHGLDVESARAQFPALQRTVAGRPAVYADGPGGTQVPQRVIDAMTGFMAGGGSNLGGPFVTSVETGRVQEAARSAVADFYGAASPDEIVFGQNMTSLTFAVGRALGRTWQPGDEIVLTRLDHDANIAGWMHAAAEAGASVRWVDFDPDSGKLDPDWFDDVLSQRTRLVAVTHASNAIGTVVDVAAVVAKAHAFGALVYVDAVHYAPHGPIDVGATECDFLTASAYKFFGPHTGAMYGRLDLLASIDAIKVRSAPPVPPGKWETGTQSFESLAGVAAAVDYLEQFGDGASRRERLVAAMAATQSYEAELTRRFLDGISSLDKIRLYGIDSAESRTPTASRTPTFAISVAGMSPKEVAAVLGDQGIFVWHGHYYALEVIRRLGTQEAGGLVRIGFVHYNTPGEVDRVLEALGELS